MMNKKGISGLVVAVLLVAISLTIGGLVMGWMSGFADSSLSDSTEEQKVQDECLDRSFKVISVEIRNSTGGLDHNKSVELNIENSGEQTIKGFLFKFSTVANDLFAIEMDGTNDALSEYSRKTYTMDGGTTDTGGVNTPLNKTRTNPASGSNYVINKVEVVPIVDVVVDVTKTVKCDDRAKEVTESAFTTCDFPCIT